MPPTPAMPDAPAALVPPAPAAPPVLRPAAKLQLCAAQSDATDAPTEISLIARFMTLLLETALAVHQRRFRPVRRAYHMSRWSGVAPRCDSCTGTHFQLRDRRRRRPERLRTTTRAVRGSERHFRMTAWLDSDQGTQEHHHEDVPAAPSD